MKTWKSKLSTAAAALLIGTIGFGSANAAPTIAANGFANAATSSTPLIVPVRYHGHRHGHFGYHRHRNRFGYNGRHRFYGHHHHHRFDDEFDNGWPLALALAAPFFAEGFGYGPYGDRCCW